MRVLHLVGRSHRRGAETFALELAHELDALGGENRVVALAPAFDGARDPEIPTVASRVTLNPATLGACAWRVRRMLTREPVDVVLAHGGSAAEVASVACRGTSARVVWQRILGFPPAVWRWPRRRWWQATVGHLHAAVALTQQLSDEVRQLGFNGPIWIIGNARSPQRFVRINRAAESERLRREAGIEADVPLLGFVGHLNGQKRPDRALEVLDGVLERGQRAHLVIAGDGPSRDRVARAIRDRGLDSHVTLLGHRPDVERVYGAIDVALLTSETEGIPGVAIEAQMTGCPVVTFPTGGVDEVVDDGQTGIVLERADTRLMAERAAELLTQPDLRRRLGERARQRAETFSTRRVALEYAARLEELCAPTGGQLHERAPRQFAMESRASGPRIPRRVGQGTRSIDLREDGTSLELR